MTNTPDAVGRALTGGAAACTVGRFRYEVAADRWTWSDEVYRMHGFEPGEVVPTTELMVTQLHPDDRDQAPETLPDGAVASIHRIVDAAGGERVLATVVEGGRGEPPELVQGFVVDVTAPMAALVAAEAAQQVRRSDERRAVIDQAIGVVAARTGLSVDEAFGKLRAASMHDNVKLRDVALRVVAAVTPRRGVLPPTPTGPWTSSLVALLPSPRPADPDTDP